MSLAVGTILGAYAILGRLGAGGMSEVFRAWDPKLGREVALKVLPEAYAGDAERLARFELETRSLAALSHPNVVQVFDAGEHEGRPYLVMELLEGETLRQRLDRGPIAWPKAAGLGASIAEGLAAAHAKGIVHRDLKPENLMLTVHGHVKILDFGLAKLRAGRAVEAVSSLPAGACGADGFLTETGTVMGTAHYMSPEQVQDAELDARTDLFSLGVILWEMVTGLQPFHGDTSTETMTAILRGEPAGRSRLPFQLAPILDTCLEKDPARRFQSARDLAVSLRSAALGSSRVRAAWDSATRRRVGIRRTLLKLSGGALLLILAAGGGYAWRGRGGPDPGTGGRPPSVMALPAKVMGTPEAAFLADEVPSTLSTLLAGSKGLETRVPPSSLDVARAGGDLARLVEARRADNLVITTLTKRKDRLILNVQLADTKTWRVLWGQQYEGTLADYQDLMREAAGSIARILEPGGSPFARAGGVAPDAEASLALAEGRRLYHRYLVLRLDRDFRRSLAAFQRALAREPGWVEAAAWVATLHGARACFLGVSPDGGPDGRQAEAWARRALRLDPKCGAAWSVLADMETLRRPMDPEKAVAYAVKAVCLSPFDARASLALGSLACGPGSMDLLLAAGTRASELDPLDPSVPGRVALGLSAAGRLQEALAVLDRALRSGSGSVRSLQRMKVQALVRLGRLGEAEQALAASGLGADPEARLWILAGRGRLAEARELGRTLAVRWTEGRAPAAALATRVVLDVPWLARIGLRDEALALMQASTDAGATPCLDWLLAHPDLQPLRGDPRFGPIQATSRRAAVVMVRHLELAWSRGELPGYLEAPLSRLRDQVGRDVARR